jgi:hypothetical protein
MWLGATILIVGVVAFGLLLLRSKKKEGYSEAQIQQAKKEQEAREIIDAKLKKNAIMRANTSIAERLRNIKYRD